MADIECDAKHISAVAGAAVVVVAVAVADDDRATVQRCELFALATFRYVRRCYYCSLVFLLYFPLSLSKCVYEHAVCVSIDIDIVLAVLYVSVSVC